MILYTPLSMEEIFPATDSSTTQLIQYEGKHCYAEPLEDGQYKLVQLLSTNPHDFLEVNYMPGRVITKDF
ncbi:YlzJ-like family protein [Ornithinibacillus sp. 4-3]|uniref:YlzJ-like family protein n=1 Tax=Ornithinibacillus sp. 4-3 TaxID=3231488 RepID=A0AB39HWS7_9BACI